MTKNEAIEQLKKDGWCFKPMIEFHGDRDVALVAVEKNGYNLSHLSDELKDDKEVVSVAVKQQGMALEYVSDRLRDDEEIIEFAIKNRPDAIRWTNENSIARKKQKSLEMEQEIAERNEEKERIKQAKFDEVSSMLNEVDNLSKEHNRSTSEILSILQILELQKYTNNMLNLENKIGDVESSLQSSIDDLYSEIDELID